MPTFQIGSSASFTKVITAEDIQAFAATTGDFNPIHLDDTYAAETRFGRPIAHGMLAAGLVSAVLGNQLPGPGSIYLAQTLKFVAPVYIGDEVTATVEVISSREDKPIVTLRTVCTNQQRQTVLEGEAVLLVPMESRRRTNHKGRV
jgi:3-hydroxybutyryl-CoA dehydratase